jgi:hypothetical protein
MVRNVFLSVALAVSTAGADILLDGDWEVSGKDLAGTVKIPGTLADSGLGRKTSEKEYLATADVQQRGALVRDRLYEGKAVYVREFEVSAADAGKSWELVLERVMWRSEVKIDGREIGWRDSLSTPHVYRVGTLAAGRHRLEVAVDNSCFYGFSRYAHSYGPVMQSVWHGILGKVAFRPANPLASARVFAPYPPEGAFKVEVGDVKIDSLSVPGLKIESWKQDGDTVEVAPAENPVGWSEFNPRLYTLRLKAGEYSHSIRFGFRSYSAKDRAFYVNGVKSFMRGNVDNCNFAETGAPPTDKRPWLDIFRTLKYEDGINLVRFHSWCPPAAAFEAADELGVYLMPEVGIWTDKWMAGRDRDRPAPSPLGHGHDVDAFVERELRDIVDAYGNHPSFVSLGIGNELGNSDFKVMADWIADIRKHDPRRLYFASTARTITEEDDFSVTHLVPGIGWVRGRFKDNTDWDYEDVYSKTPVPVMAHEIGQWPVYPLWDSLEKFDRGILRPYNLLRYRRQAESNGVMRFNRIYHEASAKANRLVYKEEVESFLRTPSCAGVQLLNVQDFTGQGEALVGWRDAFYDLKPAFECEKPFRDIWGEVNFLARFEKFAWVAGEKFRARLLVRNLTGKKLRAGTTFDCSLDGRCCEVVLPADIGVGEIGEAGDVVYDCGENDVGKHTLRFGSNEWSFWVYPDEKTVAVPDGIVMTGDYAAAAKALASGGTVLYTGEGRRTAKDTFLPVYWSVIHFENKNPLAATLGTWVDSSHPALKGFITEDWADWQWQGLVDGATVHELRDMPDDYMPICLSVSDFHVSLFLSSLYEVKVGEGRLLVCGYRLDGADPVSRRLRASLVDYLATTDGAELARMDAQWFERSFRPLRKAKVEKVVKVVEENGWKVFRIDGAEAFCGTFKVRFAGGEVSQAEFEGRPASVTGRGGTCEAAAKVMSEDMLDGVLEFRFRAGADVSVAAVSMTEDE